MAKVMYEVISIWGYDDERVDEYGVIEDTKENRKFLIEDNFYVEDEEELEDYYSDFLNGKSNFTKYENYVGDWDAPKGGYEIRLYSYEEKMKQLQKKYDSDISELKKLFTSSKR